MPNIRDFLTDMSGFALFVFVLSLSVFAVYYVRRARRAAVTTDLWITFYFVLAQNFLFLPVSYSSLNSVLIGNVYDEYIGSVDFVVWLSIFGTICFAGGAWRGWRSARQPIGFAALYRVVDRFWMTAMGPWFGLGLLALFALALMSQGISFGQARLAVMDNPSLQPINNMLNALAQLFVLIALFQLFKRPRFGSYLVLALTLGASFYGGTRSASVWPLLLGGSILIHLAGVKRVLPAAGGLAALIVFAVAYGQFRNDNGFEWTSGADFLQELLFGGHLTEQRDFAWVYSVWDHSYLWGKSVLAGLMGFIPSFISDFRQEWSWGRFTARAAGLDPTTFAGFRLPVIGEPFFNFSWAGIAIVSYLLGWVTFRLSKMIENAARVWRTQRGESLILAATVAIYLNLLQLSLVSVTIFVVYVHLAVLASGAIFARLRGRNRDLASA